MPKDIRPIRVEGQLAYVPLTRGYEAVIDLADVPLVEGYNWYAFVDGPRIYARRCEAGVSIYLHKVILGVLGSQRVDHKDGSTLNNRRDNLRKATHAQNMRNQKIRADSTTGFKGVSFSKGKGKFMAYIRFEGKRKHLGYHNTPEDAHAAYCAESIKLHGHFSRLA
jgi:hypothetical protein